MHYQAYAPYYDITGQVRFAVLMMQYLREVLARHPAGGARAIDLACGTGTLALMLADEGWDVLGLDASEPMLAQARAKAANLDTSGRARFVAGDMRHLPAVPGVQPAGFDLATCVYDSLNYLLSEAELAACFGGVARLLAPGGLLVADMNTRHFLEHDWGTCEVLELPGFVQVAQSYFDPATDCSTMLLTGFVGDDAEGYERFDETHIERAYDPELIAALLSAAGLRLEASYDCFTFQPVGAHTQRIAFIARKAYT
ncbi:MAG: methyltransferase domain-containing protein [Kouleothrix sp.]|jgi:ubiquinone/menaquinone biosynthesis C-methylase UbiE|nr:class I SAM-dependent methyltransferase [Kouleothrix sp.]